MNGIKVGEWPSQEQEQPARFSRAEEAGYLNKTSGLGGGVGQTISNPGRTIKQQVDKEAAAAMVRAQRLAELAQRLTPEVEAMLQCAQELSSLGLGHLLIR